MVSGSVNGDATHNLALITFESYIIQRKVTKSFCNVHFYTYTKFYTPPLKAYTFFKMLRFYFYIKIPTGGQ